MGRSFEENARVLEELSKGLRESIESNDYKKCIDYCLSILQWGKVLNKNDKKIQELGEDVCQYFKKSGKRAGQ